MNNYCFFIFFVVSFFAFGGAFFTRIFEGHVGVYSIMGQIQDTVITKSTLYLPGYSDIKNVKFIQDHDFVHGMKFTSSEGVSGTILSIEIANEIIQNKIVQTIKRFGFEYDKVLVVNPLDQYMREICANLTIDEIEIAKFHEHDDRLKREIQRQNDELQTGIKINYVRVSGIIVPDEIKIKRLGLATEKSDKLLAVEKMNRIKIEKTTEVLVAQKDNDMKEDKVTSENNIRVMNAKAEQTVQEIHNVMTESKAKTNDIITVGTAKANSEKAHLEADITKTLFAIPGYTDVEIARHLSQNQKTVIIGNEIPKLGFMAMPMQINGEGKDGFFPMAMSDQKLGA